jgi:hypothetical protein
MLTTTEKQKLEFFTMCVPRGYNDNRLDMWEGGLEYPLRSSGSRNRRQKGNPVPGDIAGPPFSLGGDIHTRNWPSRLEKSHMKQ